MEEDNLNSIIQGILAEAATQIREAFDKNAEAESEATLGSTEFYALTADGDVIVLDAKAERAGTVVGLLGNEWVCKYPTGRYGTESKRWESWDGEVRTASEFAEMCRTAHTNGNTNILIHKGY